MSAARRASYGPKSCRPIGRRDFSCRERAICDKVNNPALSTLDGIIASYIREYRQSACEESAYFKNLKGRLTPTAIAGLFNYPKNKRHSHQRRITQIAIRQFARRVATLNLKRPKNFDELHALIQRKTADIRGIGPLAIYDLSRRVGLRFEHRPDKVYLHAGALTGARRLGLHATNILAPSSLPGPFKKLTPAQIEDCLCIYSNCFNPSMRTL